MRKTLTIFILVSLFLPLLTLAQVKGGDIYGTVVLGDGSKAVGVWITLTRENVEEQATLSSAKDGSFSFLDLPPGTYSLSFKMRGFKTFSREDIEILPEQTYLFTINMQTGLIDVEITTAGKTVNKGSLLESSTSKQLDELTGIWESNLGVTYEIIRQDNHLTWLVRDITERGEITMDPDQLHSEWNGSRGSGSTTGRVVEYDNRGKPKKIRWANDVIFTKTTTIEPSTISLYHVFLKLQYIDHLISPKVYNDLAEAASQLIKTAKEIELEKLKEAKEKEQAANYDWTKFGEFIAYFLTKLKQLCSGLSQEQMQQLYKIPQGYGFNKYDSKTIVEGIIGIYAGVVNYNAFKPAANLLDSLSETDSVALTKSLLTAVAKMKGFKDFNDIFS